jgi:hypothetical protein
MTTSDCDLSPFASLGITPTLDVAAIKRAYFAALAKHPPHSDPEGFKRIRSAYEALGPRGEAASFVLRSAVDVATELARYRARHDAGLARAHQAQTATVAESGRVARFVEGIARLDLNQALTLFGPKSG